jgi:Dihydrodipicolinate synthetase family
MPRATQYVPHGVIPAVLLPFAEDLSIDENSFRKHLRDVAETSDLSAITINAHSTEVASCTLDEQRRVLDIARDEVGGRLPIVNGVWADGSLEAARIARMAEKGGAAALLVFPPAPFTLGQSPAMAVEHFKRIADASALPIIAFQYPLATDRSGLSARNAAEAGRGGPLDPRHQGLVGQRAAARNAHPRAAEPPAAGQRAHHPQRMAAEFPCAGLQWGSLRQRQRHRRSASCLVDHCQHSLLLSARPKRPFRNWLSGVQLIEQRLRLFQIARVEPFSEPAKESRERLSCFVPFPLTA